MASLSGVNASVKIGTVLVANMAKWEFTDETEALEAPVFGLTFTTVHGLSVRKVAGSISGYLDIADTTGQEALKAAYEAQTLLQDFRLHIDDETLSTYYTSDDAVSGHGVYLLSMSIGAEQNAIIPVEIGFIVTGGWKRVTEV